jgi:hypothetical protein
MASPVNVAGATMVKEVDHLGASRGTQTQSQMGGYWKNPK